MKKIFIISCLILGLFGLWQIKLTVFAEQSGSSPNNSTNSRIKTLNDALTVLGAGSTASGAWGDWGTMWNRIYSAGIWDATLGDAVAGEVFSGKKFYAGANRTLLTGTFSFTGDAAVGDVVTGKTFYANSSTKQTGTGPAIIDYSKQSLATKDDYLGTYKDEESTWSQVSGSPFSPYTGLESGSVYQDSRTGLWWSARSSSTVADNSFTSGGDGVRPTLGSAIAICTTLNTNNFGGKSNWYLPTQKELIQAYIDGMYSQVGSTFTTTSYCWSSTEYSNDPTDAWYVYLYRGGTSSNLKTTATYYARCVRRD